MRVSSLAIMLALSVGNMALCAGWQATPEARMACCSTGVACPMHQATPTSATDHSVSQADADQCCASSQRGEGGPSTAFSPLSLCVASLPITFDAIESARPTQARRHEPSPPLQTRSVARHVLLSVFLL